MKTIVIAAGGTGGHLFPAQALAEQLVHVSLDDSLLFIAGGLKTNRFFDRERFLYEEVPCSPLLSKNPLKMIKGVFNLIHATVKSIEILKEKKVSLVVGFGSYYTVPVILAARWLNIPIILHEANNIPGKANRLLGRFASCVALNFPNTASFFKGKTEVVGLPLRATFYRPNRSKESALTYYDLSSQKKVFLIYGGSQGAKAINDAIINFVENLSQFPLQIIHLTGNDTTTEYLKELYQKHNIKAAVKTFENNMHFAWTACDFFIGRSGASTVAESIECEVPGILIPYPYANQHQETNADFLINEVNSSIKISQQNLSVEALAKALRLFCDEKYLESKKKAIKDYKSRFIHKSFVDIIHFYLSGGL